MSHKLALITLASLVSAPAFAVQTRDCPLFFDMKFQGVHVDAARVAEIDDPVEAANLDQVLNGGRGFAGVQRLEGQDHLSMSRFENGRCEYKSAGARVEIYSKNGKNLLRYEMDQIQVYAEIESMSRDSLNLKAQGSYGLKALYCQLDGNQCTRGYDGGMNLISVGSVDQVTAIAD